MHPETGTLPDSSSHPHASHATQISPATPPTCFVMIHSRRSSGPSRGDYFAALYGLVTIFLQSVAEETVWVVPAGDPAGDPPG
jgi:hypothetical protein